MCDIHLSINSLCRKKVEEKIPEMKMFVRKNYALQNASGKLPEDFKPSFSTCNRMLISAAVLFAISTTAYLVLECLSSNLILNIKPLWIAASGAALLGVSFSSIIAMTGLLLYRGQMNQIFHLEAIEDIRCQRASVVYYRVD